MDTYYQKNKDKLKKYIREWKRRNPEKAQYYRDKWRKNNLERQGEFTKEWQRNNREKFLASNRKSYEFAMFGRPRKEILERDNYTCQNCGIILSSNNLQIHHIDWLGSNVSKEYRNNIPENLIALCRRCHNKIHQNNLELFIY